MPAWKIVKSSAWAHHLLLIIGVALGTLGLVVLIVGLTAADPVSPATPSAAQLTPLHEEAPAGSHIDLSTCECGRFLTRSFGSSSGRPAGFRLDRAGDRPSTGARTAMPGGALSAQQELWRAAYDGTRNILEIPVVPLRVIANPMRIFADDQMFQAQFVTSPNRQLATDATPEPQATPIWLDPQATLLVPPR